MNTEEAYKILKDTENLGKELDDLSKKIKSGEATDEDRKKINYYGKLVNQQIKALAKAAKV